MKRLDLTLKTKAIQLKHKPAKDRVFSIKIQRILSKTEFFLSLGLYILFIVTE
jgi:hypothetical protein